MADFPALSLWTDAYLADTTDLSAEEHGVYLLLLMAAWRSPDCALPDDDTRLSRMARIGTKKWQKLRPVMERFWTIDARGWTQKRLLEERARIETLRSHNSTAGKASALKRKKIGSTSVGTGRATQKQLPIPNTQLPPLSPPQGGSDSDLVKWYSAQAKRERGARHMDEDMQQRVEAAMRRVLEYEGEGDPFLAVLGAMQTNGMADESWNTMMLALSRFPDDAHRAKIGVNQRAAVERYATQAGIGVNWSALASREKAH